MKQFLTLMDGMVEYRQMKEALQQGRVPVSVSGVSASHKTHIIASLAAQLENPRWSSCRTKALRFALQRT